MIHSLKVGQIARRIAEFLQHTYHVGNDVIDPEAAESSGLAHDLGHPPFGHIGEDTLNTRLKEHNEEGYEGNAQSFRIVNSLSSRSRDHSGLNLTKRTLNGILKYPRLQTQPPNLNKWGSYAHETNAFRWARDGIRNDTCTLEASVMDWADDITYAIHDVEDFYRAGLIPLHFLSESEAERNRFLDATRERWEIRNPNLHESFEAYRNIFHRLIEPLPLQSPYGGTAADQAQLREITSLLIGRFVGATSLVDDPAMPTGKQLHIDEEMKKQVKIIKELNWHYVVESAALRTQQRGHRRIIERLFDVYVADAEGRLIPAWLPSEIQFDVSPARRAADTIASLTDQQAMLLHERLTGHHTGSIRDWF